MAQAQMAQAGPQEVPEQVLITGSLIRGTAAVGVPVTNLSPQDFNQTGALTTADLFRTFPAANVNPGPIATQSGANIERAVKVNIRGLDTGTAARNLMMVDGVRVPPMSNGVCVLDPSIIPSLSIDRIDVLVDGASATYGSDAIGGVINIILKRAYEGAVTQLRYTTGAGGKARYQASQLWGRTWDGGDITLSYEWYDDAPIQGNFHSQFTVDFTPWGLDSRVPIGSSIPGTISTGAPTQPASLGLTTGTNATVGTNCTNCWAVPRGAGANFSPINGGIGPTAPFSGSTLNWASFNVAGNAGTNGTRNVFNPYSIAWYDAAEQRNALVGTFDQRLTRNISLYGDGFYSNRRAQFLNPANLSPAANDILTGIGVPTFNPYYPTGGAPTNLRVSYNTAVELPPFTSAFQVDNRYLVGLNIDLPGNWRAKAYYAMTQTYSWNYTRGSVNKNGVSAALGWTMAATGAAGTTPGIATWTKPATVPYLNLFCDPTAFKCNSDTTLGYVQGLRNQSTRFWVNEKAVNFDGPLFTLPAGDVKAAIGASYTSYHFNQTAFDNTNNTTLLLPMTVDPEYRAFWSVFGQVNIPVIGEANALPLVKRFELEGSWRHDQYTDVGGTSNPKVAFNWMLSQDIGLMIRGTWGTSFRAPGFGETSPIAGFAVNGWGLPPAVFTNNASIAIQCTGGVPAPGSGAAKLFAAGFGCNSNPAGVSFNGGSRGPVDAGWRDFVNQDQRVLKPEMATNWGIGFDFAPTTFLPGLDVQATWYSIKINGTLQGFGNPTSQAFNDPGRGFSYLVPSDVGCPASANSAPTTCANFQLMVASMLTNPRSAVGPLAQTSVFWLNDGGTFNKGWLKTEGIDWTASYDIDLGEYGAWNTGMVGTYYLHRQNVTIPGAPGDAGAIQDSFHTTLAPVGGIAQVGVESLPRLRYRARLGWSNGPWSVTGFMNSQSHYFHTQSAPPNVNFQCVTSGGTVGGGTFPCAINNYTNIEPSMYTFDLSIGYNTGDTPVNDYLKNVGIQLVAQNVTDKHPSFQYRTTSGGGNPSAWELLYSGAGRQVSLILTKTW